MQDTEKTPPQKEPVYAVALSRENVNAMPVNRYEGPITLVRNAEEAVAAVEHLRRDHVLGFDTETRPSFRKGESYLPSLVQLAGSDCVYLFQLTDGSIFPPLKALLSDASILKTGVALEYDCRQLRVLDDFEPGGFTALEPLARAARIKNQGLRGLGAALLGFRISKRAQCSNWSRQTLTEAQILYAATDAWVSRCIYFELLERTASIATPPTE